MGDPQCADLGTEEIRQVDRAFSRLLPLPVLRNGGLLLEKSRISLYNEGECDLTALLGSAFRHWPVSRNLRRSISGEKGTVLDKKKFFCKNNIHFLLFLTSLAAVVLSVVLFDAFSYRLPLFDGNDSFTEPGWYFGEKGGDLEPTALSDKHWIEPGKTYVLTTELVYDGQGDDYPSALFTVGNYQVRVLLDEQEMFSYTKDQRGFPRIKGMGGAAFTVPLGKNCQGRTLTLELTTSMDYGSLRRMPGITLF